jgi:hypothetical protein
MSNFEFGGLPNIDFSNIDLSNINQDELRAAIGDLNLPAVGNPGLPPGLDIGPGLEAQIAAEAVPAPVAAPTPTPSLAPIATPAPTEAPTATTYTPPAETVYTESAFGIIKSTLEYYGLSDTDLLTSVRGLWENKTLTPGMSVDDIGIQLRDTPAFNKRFPANKTLKDQNKPQFSVSRYLQMEADYKQRLQAANMPAGFYDDPADFQQLIANDVSPQELQGRIDLGYQAVKNASPTVIAEFKRLYGVGEGDLAAYFIDPQRARPTFDKYEAQRQAQAAAVSSQAQIQAGIQLSAQESEALVRSGITEAAQAQTGFEQISAQQELFNPLQGEQAISREQQIAGTFGTNAEARKAIANRKRSRQAAFETGGGFATAQGASALGTVGQ